MANSDSTTLELTLSPVVEASISQSSRPDGRISFEAPPAVTAEGEVEVTFTARQPGRAVLMLEATRSGYSAASTEIPVSVTPRQIVDEIRHSRISTIFVVTIAFLFICASIFPRIRGFSKRRFLVALDRVGAGLMTMLGVLGTFTGILVGLLGFEATRIDDSIPLLLDGLTIAFSTSIVGLGAAILFRMLQSLWPVENSEEPPGQSDKATQEELLPTLQEIRDGAKRSSDELIGDFQRFATDVPTQIESALRDIREGAEQSSARLIGEFRDFAQTMPSEILAVLQGIKDGAKQSSEKLISEFREFAQTMAKDNSAALMDALQQVIRDFNTKLSEQFGDNFKQLNAAVGALLTWQDNYRKHVEQLDARMEAEVEAVEIIRKSIEEIPAYLQRIPEMLTPLDGLLTGMRASVRTLEAHLEALAALKEHAVEAIPTIEANLQKVTAEVGLVVSGAVNKMSAEAAEHGRALDTLRAGYTALHASAEESQRAFAEATAVVSTAVSQSAEAIEVVVSKATGSLAVAADGLGATIEQLKSGFEELSVGYAALRDDNRQFQDFVKKEVARTLLKTAEELRKHFDTFDSQMQNELSRVINEMGGLLAALSEKFVKDYEPLTNKLQEVVRIAEQIDLDRRNRIR